MYEFCLYCFSNKGCYVAFEKKSESQCNGAQNSRKVAVIFSNIPFCVESRIQTYKKQQKKYGYWHIEKEEICWTESINSDQKWDKNGEDNNWI